ncbi:MAG: alpha/beta fold hydrolase [Oceanospirillaceae bacterium]|nr:alpha/beta fold hydrolase [Oceanospirillaceae bacterium]
MRTEKFTFKGHSGDLLAAKLVLPEQPTEVGAVFAHCFTCSKDILAARRISVKLADAGIAVLSFDFTGLGHSAGEFSNTHFSSNVTDLLLASDALSTRGYSVQLLVGHSLGGAAVISAAGLKKIADLKAVAVIGAPFEPAHVLENFSGSLADIELHGAAKVVLGGRQFEIKQAFVHDISRVKLQQSLKDMRQALMVLHAPLDSQVNIDNAAAIFEHARHPKSFVSLDNADHLLTKARDAEYAATVIAAWSARYVQFPATDSTGQSVEEGVVRVSEVDSGGFKQDINVEKHHILADEPLAFGGSDMGLTPYQLLSSALGACTNMTIRMYARRKKIPLEGVEVNIEHNKVHALDCQDCAVDATHKIDQFVRRIKLTGELTLPQHQQLLAIADKCPVHRTLEGKIEILTQLQDKNSIKQ